MTTRQIAGRPVSPIGMGCMGLTHGSGAPMEKSAAVKLIRGAFEMGYTLFDTAECYTGVCPDGSTAYNEELLGEALSPIRNQVMIATKFGVRHAPDKSLLLDSRPESIRTSVESSLKRLGLECIDLYYQHRIDPQIPPEVVAETMSALLREGKIRAWGISEATEDYFRRAHAVCPVAAIQNRYSMMARWHETLFPVVEELGVAYVAFSPMANGFLTGRYDQRSRFEPGTDYRSFMPQYSPEGMEKGKALLELLARLAADKQATSAQISLAWMLCKKPWIIPIPGSRKAERLRENLSAADVVLTTAEIMDIDTRLDGMEMMVFGGHAAK